MPTHTIVAGKIKLCTASQQRSCSLGVASSVGEEWFSLSLHGAFLTSSHFLGSNLHANFDGSLNSLLGLAMSAVNAPLPLGGGGGALGSFVSKKRALEPSF